MAMLRVCCLAALCVLCTSFSFELPANGFKCFMEEIPEHEEVRGGFVAAAGYSQAIDLKITNPQGDTVFESKGRDKDDFNLWTAMNGDYNFCFYNRLVTGVAHHPGLKRGITFKVATGQEAKDYDKLARKEHMKPIEIMLRMMEDAASDIYHTYYYFKAREAELRDTSETANSRALWITIINSVIFFGFAHWQFSHLKKYFVTKKLISR